jgi:hypothetical protein
VGKAAIPTPASVSVSETRLLTADTLADNATNATKTIRVRTQTSLNASFQVILTMDSQFTRNPGGL